MHLFFLPPLGFVLKFPVAPDSPLPRTPHVKRVWFKLFTMADLKRVPIWRLILLSASTGAVDLGYAVEGAYIVPFMVASGLSLSFATVLITLSPVMGLLFQGFIGAVSDKCTCSWGRRRPFIVLFSLTAILGFAALPYCSYFKLNFLIVLGVSFFVILLDFSCGMLVLPSRAYLLDVVPASQSKTGNFILSVAIGACATLGYVLGMLDWSGIAGTSVSIQHQAQIVFGITAVAIFIAMISTIVSIKEQNPKSLKHNQLESVNQRFEESKSTGEPIDENHIQLVSVDNFQCEPALTDECQESMNMDQLADSPESIEECQESMNMGQLTDSPTIEECQESMNESYSQAMFDEVQVSKESHTYSANDDECDCDTEELLISESKKKQHCYYLKLFWESVTGVIKFAYYMSYNMWLLCLMLMFALAADFAFVYGFTTFVGVAVYEGDPSSPEDSLSYQSYTKGVRMGSLGLAIATLCASLISPVLDYITRWIRLKTVFLIILALFVCALSLLMYCRELYQVYILVTVYGPFFTTALTLPFTFIPLYKVSHSFYFVNFYYLFQKSGLLLRKEWKNRPPVIEGVAVATFSTSIFIGQIIASLIIGPVVDAVGDVNYFMLIPCFFTTLSFFSLLPVKASKRKVTKNIVT